MNHEDTKSTKEGEETKRNQSFFSFPFFVLFVSSWFTSRCDSIGFDTYSKESNA